MFETHPSGLVQLRLEPNKLSEGTKKELVKPMDDQVVLSTIEEPRTRRLQIKLESGAPAKCTRRELEELRKGDRINLFVGEAPNAALLFSVSIRLVKHFSPTWRNIIVEEQVKALYIPDSKEPVKFVIEWMVAGGSDSKGRGAVPYPDDNLINLILLSKLVYRLQIAELMLRTLKCINCHTQQRPKHLYQMVPVLSIRDVPSQVRFVVGHNLRQWIGTFNVYTWKKAFQEAEGRTDNKDALAILAGMRTEVEKAHAQFREQNRAAKLPSEARNGRGEFGQENVLKPEISQFPAKSEISKSTYRSRKRANARRQHQAEAALKKETAAKTTTKSTLGTKAGKDVGDKPTNDAKPADTSETTTLITKGPRYGQFFQTDTVRALVITKDGRVEREMA